MSSQGGLLFTWVQICPRTRNPVKTNHRRLLPAIGVWRWGTDSSTKQLQYEYASSQYCFIWLGFEAKMRLIFKTLNVVPKHIPSKYQEGNLSVHTFWVLHASGTAVPHTSPIRICVSCRPTQRLGDVRWTMSSSIYPSRYSMLFQEVTWHPNLEMPCHWGHGDVFAHIFVTPQLLYWHHWLTSSLCEVVLTKWVIQFLTLSIQRLSNQYFTKMCALGDKCDEQYLLCYQRRYLASGLFGVWLKWRQLTAKNISSRYCSGISSANLMCLILAVHWV